MRTRRPYVRIDPDELERIRQIDLLTYLREFEPGNLQKVMYISDKLTILHGQSDHLSRRFRSLISERDSRRSKSFL